MQTPDQKYQINVPKVHLLERSLSLTLLTVSIFPLLILLPLHRVFIRRSFLFKQLRIGCLGRPFTIYKLRTIVSNDVRDHQSVSTFGVFLRALSFDELPSFLNVLKGEMRFVGPRPLLIEDKDDLDKICFERFFVKPGITGYVQILGRNCLSWRRRISLDTKYYFNRSFIETALIVCATFVRIFVKNSLCPRAHGPSVPLSLELRR